MCPLMPPWVDSRPSEGGGGPWNHCGVLQAPLGPAVLELPSGQTMFCVVYSWSVSYTMGQSVLLVLLLSYSSLREVWALVQPCPCAGLRVGW